MKNDDFIESDAARDVRLRERDLFYENYDITERLEYLRGEIRAERISYGEIAELQSLIEHIDESDTELLAWADVEESPNQS